MGNERDRTSADWAVRKHSILTEYRDALESSVTLTAEEERDAARRGDHELLARSQYRWVARLVLQFSVRRRFDDVDSLMSAGFEALWGSVHKFDPDFGFRLTTFVGRPVYWACDKVVRDSYSKKEVGRDEQGKAIFRFMGGWGEEPPLYLEQEQPQQLCPDELEALESVLTDISEREEHILRMWSHGVSFQEIGTVLGITRQRVKQIFDLALRKARVSLKERGFAYLEPNTGGVA